MEEGASGLRINTTTLPKVPAEVMQTGAKWFKPLILDRLWQKGDGWAVSATVLAGLAPRDVIKCEVR